MLSLLVPAADRRFSWLSRYPQAQLEQLEQQIADAQTSLTQKRVQYKKLQTQQRTLVLGALELSKKMMRVGTEAVRAAKHDTTARSATPQKNSDNRLRVAKKFTLFDTPSTPPRPLHSFQHFASIRYNDLHDVLESVTAQTKACSAAKGAGVASDTGTSRQPMGSTRQRRRTRQTVPIDTVSNNVTLRGLVLEYLHQTSSDISVPESDVCWFLDTGHPISPTLNLAYSSSLSSRECTTSVLLNYVAIAFEHSLHLELGARFPCSAFHCILSSVTVKHCIATIM